MRTCWRIVLAVAVAACLSSAVQAQRGFGRGGGMGGPLGLLSNPSVQKELGLSEDQVKKVQTVTKEITDKHADERAEIRQLGRGSDEAREKSQALNKKIADEMKEGLKGVLTTKQEKRLNQIALQARGIQAFNDPEVQKKLDLKDDQKEKLKTIAEDSQNEIREAFQGARAGGGDFQEAMKKITALRKEALDKATSVLDDTQKKTWQDMTGKPFQIQFPARGGRGGRRGAGGGQNQ
jgi:hypothetical protein